MIYMKPKSKSKNKHRRKSDKVRKGQPLPEDDTPQEILTKFNSRKYQITVFWNFLGVICVGIQSALGAIAAFIPMPALLEVAKLIPSNSVIIIAGALTAGYIGVNILDKKFNGQSIVGGSTIGVDPNSMNDQVLQQAQAAANAQAQRQANAGVVAGPVANQPSPVQQTYAPGAPVSQPQQISIPGQIPLVQNVPLTAPVIASTPAPAVAPVVAPVVIPSTMPTPVIAPSNKNSGQGA